MQLSRPILFGLGALLAALGFSALQGKKKKLSQMSRGMVVGDSHSEADWTFGGRLGSFLRSKGLNAKVLGNRGWSVKKYIKQEERPESRRTGSWRLQVDGAKGRSSLGAELATLRPEVVIFALGANDMATNETEYKAHLRRLVALSRQAGAKRIIWFGPSKSEGAKASLMPNRNTIARWQREVLPGEKVEWHSSMPLTFGLATADGVHYRRPEYKIWSDRAQAKIEA